MCVHAKQTPAVIAAYYPNAEFLEQLQRIREEFCPVIVWDNTPEQQVRDNVSALAIKAGCSYATEKINLGTSGALNRVFARLVADGFSAAVAFDQDSLVLHGFSHALQQTVESLPHLAILGANWRDEARPNHSSPHLQRHPVMPLLFSRTAAVGEVPLDVTFVITSGSWFDLRVWQRLGGFDEALFLDFVDIDYCLRAQCAGYKIAVAPSARLLHNRGHKRPIRAFGKTWWPAFMPPLRLRYVFRNRLLLVRRHGLQTPHWVAFELIYSLKVIAEIVLLEDRKWAKLAACARGVWDGLLGRGGRIQ